LEELKEQVESLSLQLRAAEATYKDANKEQEDLLVLLDEISNKRKRDKEKLRAAGLEVSDGGEDDGD
jgi:chromosome segregation ATPase